MLHKLTQESLKSLLNTKRAVFILTTNNLAKLDKGLRDRCVLIEMNAANDSEYLPLARRRMNDMNVALTDEQLLEAISLGRGSIRTVMEQVELTARRHLKKHRIAANGPQSSIAA